MKLSILDQAPISVGTSPQQALQQAMKLAKLGDELGYERYWIAEHHDMPGLACSAPEVMLSYIGAHTLRIRLGAGAMLVPFYRPYKVAETFNMLATLFPNRIDLGIGRAPGGSAGATMALSDHYLEQVYKLPKLVDDILSFLYGEFPPEHPYTKVNAAPIPDIPPSTWIVGTSIKSAKLAAEKGLAYTFGHFMSDKDGLGIVKTYREQFQHKRQNKPAVTVAVSVFCADTYEQANRQALSFCYWKLQNEQGIGQNGIPSYEEAAQYRYKNDEEEKINQMKQKMIIGRPEDVKIKLLEIKETYDADEMMIVTNSYEFTDRMTSYQLLAKECFN